MVWAMRPSTRSPSRSALVPLERNDGGVPGQEGGRDIEDVGPIAHE